MPNLREAAMVQAPPTKISFDQFIDWYPENSEHRYELHRGKIVEMPNPTGKHSLVSGFLAAELNFEIRRTQQPFFIPKECTIRAQDEQSGYNPDVIVLDHAAIEHEPSWEKSSVITMGRSIQLVIEVVSTNWQDDSLIKLNDYERLEIPEYWIVDYLGIGGRRYIGNPKQPTFSVYQLIAGEYEVRQFRGNERIESAIFPELDLIAGDVFSGRRSLTN
jgi:Uma2 family endonuclease